MTNTLPSFTLIKVKIKSYVAFLFESSTERFRLTLLWVRYRTCPCHSRDPERRFILYQNFRAIS